MKRIILVGPTASGKTTLGVALAQQLGGEVVSADSMQIYRGMDIGTAKPTPEEMQGVPHHMIDIADPTENYSVSRYAEEASACVDDILARAKLPIVVGGTGLYVDSVLDGYLLSDKEPDLAYRAELEKLTTPALYAQLVALMPDVQVERNNRNRVMRMLERIHDGDDAVPVGVCLDDGHEGRMAGQQCFQVMTKVFKVDGDDGTAQKHGTSTLKRFTGGKTGIGGAGR